MAETQQEGEITFDESVEGDETSTDSPSENNDTEDTQSPDGDDENSQDDTDDDDDDTGDGDDDVDDKTPFHKHPRWIERETEWTGKFNEQETRHQDDIKKLHEEIGAKPSAEASSKPMPSWFGGSKEQWEVYQADQRAEIDSAVEKATKGTLDKIDGAKAVEQKAIDDATAYMKSEITAIEGDTTLNPSGKKVDPNALLKTVMDNELVDSKGRWNYRAGMKILSATPAKTVKKPDNGAKKKIAGATTSESKGESPPKAFKTTKDFKNDKPW